MKAGKWLIAWLITLFLFLSLSLVSIKAGAAILITIPQEVIVNSPRIKLGEIANISGGSKEQIDILKSINLGNSSLPGYTRTIPAEQIKLLIENEGFSLTSFQFDLPKIVYVRTASRVIDADTLVEKAKEFLLSSLNYSNDHIEIKSRFIPPEIILPEKDYQLEFEHTSGANKLGNISLKASIIIDNMLYKRLFLGFEVKVVRQVRIAKRPISVGEKINEADFYLDTRAVTSLSGDLILNFDNQLVRDGVVKIPIPQDSILTSHYLTLPIVIRPGDKLQAEIVSGSICVTTTVIARQSGRKGEYITVENSNTGHRFNAQIVSPNMVRLVQY